MELKEWYLTLAPQTLSCHMRMVPHYWRQLMRNFSILLNCVLYYGIFNATINSLTLENNITLNIPAQKYINMVQLSDGTFFAQVNWISEYLALGLRHIIYEGVQCDFELWKQVNWFVSIVGASTGEVKNLEIGYYNIAVGIGGCYSNSCGDGSMCL